MFLKRSDWVAWNFSFWSSFIALGFMSAARMFFWGIYFEAVFARMPEPVPMSR